MRAQLWFETDGELGDSGGSRSVNRLGDGTSFISLAGRGAAASGVSGLGSRVGVRDVQLSQGYVCRGLGQSQGPLGTHGEL